MSHTPGPWTWEREETATQEFRGYSIGRSDGIVLVAPEGNILTEADARLIAAAPDLLAALEELLPEANPYSEVTSEVTDRARAAIAKATGEA